MGHNLPKLLTKFDIPGPLATAKALGLDIPHDKNRNGPDSHIGDFETKAGADVLISTKSKYWPGKPDVPK
jgi:hypothetical protein